MLRKIRNLIGHILGYGKCQSCGDSWRWAKHRPIHYNQHGAISPICEKCFDKLNVTEILEYCRQLWNRYPGNRKAFAEIEDWIKASICKGKWVDITD